MIEKVPCTFSPFLLFFSPLFLPLKLTSNSCSVSNGSATSSIHHNRRYQYSDSVGEVGRKDMTTAITQATKICDGFCEKTHKTFTKKNLYRQYRLSQKRETTV